MFDLYVSAVSLIPVVLNPPILSRSYKYGPCIGTTRIQRWKRAKALGLNPPIEVCLLVVLCLCVGRLRWATQVFEILSTKEGHEDQEYVQNVLYGEF